MPELPEVETVRSGLEALLGDQSVIRTARLMRADIRFPVPKDLPDRLRRQPVLGVHRRAKYLLLEFPGGYLLCHLGMTGSWRIAHVGDEDKHDHFYVELADGRRLAFRDPRRFGMLDWIDKPDLQAHPRLKNLGPEPLGGEFNGEYLWTLSRKRKVAVKAFLMDQKVVVGVGNIYASEALFRAGVRPTRAAGRLTREECERLVRAVAEVLAEAISAGGSTIADFKNAGGSEGYFQNSFHVYGRAGSACAACNGVIQSKVIGGRSTFWCRTCQR